jgi:hypothetical protein
MVFRVEVSFGFFMRKVSFAEKRTFDRDFTGCVGLQRKVLAFFARRSVEI